MLAEVLASLSYALDLTGGQPMGHAQRSCLIGMRIGKELGLPEAQLTSLYHALLMKDLGCSSNAARMYEIFGSDDIAAKRVSKVTDWSNLADAAKYAAAHSLPNGSLLARAQRFLHIATHQAETSQALMQARCDRGAQIALAIGLGEDAADCIRHLDEHWDGRGAPRQVRGEAIPLLGRIACLAQTLDVFAASFSVEVAYEVARKRSGKWFDPRVVRAAQVFRQDAEFWQTTRGNPREALLTLDCRATVEAATEARIDAVCDAFAQVVDAKSSFTAEHSSRVCGYAVKIAQEMGIEGGRLTTLRRAALLHDVGKLAVSNAILDKPGMPTEEEWILIRRHPYHTQQILGRISGFERLTEIAAAHHERLNGTGYFAGRDGSSLDLDMRILSVADVFDALSAARPYRGALPLEEVFRILDRDAGVALDGDCIAALKTMNHSARFASAGMETGGQPQLVVSTPMSSRIAAGAHSAEA
jgi:HD-GYP domain-containing protein (c-di-GMP phosphodiesterase class II)